MTFSLIIIFKSQQYTEKEKFLNSFLINQKPQELFQNKLPCFAANDFCHFKNISNNKMNKIGYKITF
jgi:hypothetical protein